jgi:predicted transglutaminase-like cysteine proteinase
MKTVYLKIVLFFLALPSSYVFAGVCDYVPAMLCADFQDLKPLEGWFSLDQSLVEAAERQHGPSAGQRFHDWQQLIEDGKNLPENAKLEAVNSFFSRNIFFQEDIVNWGKDDYWATPFDTLAKGGGDCEDFAIGKYFTLIAMGIDQSKLRIAYVQATRQNLSHMVMLYLEGQNLNPLVLDNLTARIDPVRERMDLAPIYYFNESSLWKLDRNWSAKRISRAGALNLWADLHRRLLVKSR